MAHDDPTIRTSEDITDPFRLSGKLQPLVRSNGISFPPMSLEDMATCKRLGKRVSDMLVAERQRGVDLIPPHPGVAGADFAIAHARRTLRLAVLERVSDSDLLREYVQIARHIDRPTLQFSTLVPLRFAVN